MYSYKCKYNGCCTRTYCPLSVAYARTIHKFQGLSAGPVDNGKIPNMYDVLICDPDEKYVEGMALGLFYTALSRATTFGDNDGLKSAIYFCGNAFCEARVRNLTHKSNSNEEFKPAKNRHKWVDHIQHNTYKTSEIIAPLMDANDTMIKWGATTTYTIASLQSRIDTYKFDKIIKQRRYNPF